MGGRSMTWQTVKYSLWHMQSIHFAQFLCNLHTLIMRKREKILRKKARENECDTIFSISN